MSKQSREFYESQPDIYVIEKGGAVKDKRTNKWVDALSELNPHAITVENSHSMHLLRKAKNIRADRLGAIRGAGIEIPSDATEEEVVEKYGDARTAYVEHLGKLAMNAKTLRDVPTAINRLLEVDKPEIELRGGNGPLPISAPPEALLELSRRIEEEIALRLERARATDAFEVTVPSAPKKDE